MEMIILPAFIDDQPAVIIPNGSTDVKVRYFVQYITLEQVQAAQVANNIFGSDGQPKRTTQADWDAEYGEFKPYKAFAYQVSYRSPDLKDDDGNVFKKGEATIIGASDEWAKTASEITEAEAVKALELSDAHEAKIKAIVAERDAAKKVA